MTSIKARAYAEVADYLVSAFEGADGRSVAMLEFGLLAEENSPFARNVREQSRPRARRSSRNERVYENLSSGFESKLVAGTAIERARTTFRGIFEIFICKRTRLKCGGRVG